MEHTVRSLFNIDINVDEIEALVGGSLLGALQAGVILHIGDPEMIQLLGATVGAPTLIGGGLLLFVYGVLLGFPFLVFISESINIFVTRVIMFSQKSTLLKTVLVPLLTFSGLGVTLFALGLVYGAIVGIAFFGLAVPLWLLIIGYGGPIPLPSFNIVSLLAWMTYGAMMGLVYGLIQEN